MMKDHEWLTISCQKSEQRDEPPEVHFQKADRIVRCFKPVQRLEE
jgi:hypothetical protein